MSEKNITPFAMQLPGLGRAGPRIGPGLFNLVTLDLHSEGPFPLEQQVKIFIREKPGSFPVFYTTTPHLLLFAPPSLSNFMAHTAKSLPCKASSK